MLIGTEMSHIMVVSPTLGYGLSTLTLPFLRRLWEKGASPTADGIFPKGRGIHGGFRRILPF